jgi:hypothetical protein
LEKVNKGDQKKVQRDLHRIQYAKSRQLAIQGFWAFCQKYREQYLGAVKSLELEIEELLSFYEVRLPAEERKGRNAEEVEKARIAEKYGADTITDLSMGGDIPAIRRKIFETTILPITTVPIYQTVAEVGLDRMNEVEFNRLWDLPGMKAPGRFRSFARISAIDKLPLPAASP